MMFLRFYKDDKVWTDFMILKPSHVFIFLVPIG